MRDDRGQALPLILFLMLAVVAGGWALYEVGRASANTATAQTAADAAALAAVKDIRAQIKEQIATSGRVNLAAINDARVRGAAEAWAARNDARIDSFERLGADVRLEVRSNSEAGNKGRGGREGNPVTVENVPSFARARASMKIMPGAMGIGPGGLDFGGPAASADAVGDMKKMVEMAKKIDAARMPYVWGGGHSRIGVADRGDGSDPGIGFDCSGAVSAVLAAGGVLDSPMVSGNFVNMYQPGPGEVTIYANDGHVFMSLGGRFFGTSGQNPGGGAGFFGGQSTAGFVVRHVKIDPKTKVDTSDIPMNSGGDASGGVWGTPGTSAAGSDVMGEIILVDWEGPATTTTFGGADATTGNAYGPPDLEIACKIYSYAKDKNLSDRVLLSGMEAAIVESGVHNLNFGDRDSLGVFQQRPSAGWGSPEQILNVDYAIHKYFSAAVKQDTGGKTAGQVAQDTQISAFPDRYDQVESQARGLIEQMQRSCRDGRLSS